MSIKGLEQKQRKGTNAPAELSAFKRWSNRLNAELYTTDSLVLIPDVADGCATVRRVKICFWVAFISLMAVGCVTHNTAEQRFAFTQAQMGVPFRIVLYAPDQATAVNAAEAAFDRISQLNNVLSDYETDSELSRLSQTAGHGTNVPVSSELWTILERAHKLAHETGGAFDITCGPAVSQWRKARREKQLPDAVKLREVLATVGYDKLVLDKHQRTAHLEVRYMRLDLGAIAKGYAVDAALRVLSERGIQRALVSGGGDMAVSEAPPGKCGWRVSLNPADERDPTNTVDGAPTNSADVDYVLLRNNALATSGDIFQNLEIGGERYSHIVDPRTGMGLTDRSLVVVIAQDCTTADSLSTSISVLGPQKGLALAKRYGACARIARKPGENVEITQSPCFERHLETKSAQRRFSAP